MTRWERLLGWERRHRFALDLTGTLLAILLLAPASVATGAGYPGSYGLAGTVVVSVLLLLPLAWRRVRPTASAVTVYTVGLAHVVTGNPLVVPADLAVLMALYSVTVHGPRWAHRVAMGSTVLGSALVCARIYGYDARAGAASFAFMVTIGLTVWAFGLVRRARRETMEALIDRARRLEVERDQQSRIAASAERARIAREMHDIVAHSLTVMIAQADGGRYAADADPGAATRALGTIAETGRAALTDMRRLLGVLRTDGPGPTGARGTGGPEGAAGASPPTGSTAAVPGWPGTGVAAGVTTAAQPVAPQPAEGDLEALVDQVRASGLRVSLVRMGTARHLPPGVGLTVYRIAQESLTNVLKHAGPDPTVTVLVHWRPEAIVLEVSDDGRGAAADSDGLGHGLLGMRERATMFGGSVTAGPRPGGGFRVRARIPTGEPTGDGSEEER